MKKIGILGGTFNPIHHGHLILGQAAKEEFGLDEILVMPTKNPAYKTISGGVSEQNRVDMIKLAIREIKKDVTDSFFFFIMGADSLYQIETWKDPGQIFTMADILVATRNDSRSALDAQIDYLEEKYDGKIYHLSSPSIEISSNDIRKRCSNGLSIHFFLPEDVIDYIERNDLYGSTADRRKA